MATEGSGKEKLADAQQRERGGFSTMPLNARGQANTKS